jgi:pentose-5-phosphate-3-epimerase
MIELAFSILAADFSNLAAEIALDGHFVPSLTFGPLAVNPEGPQS